MEEEYKPEWVAREWPGDPDIRPEEVGLPDLLDAIERTNYLLVYLTDLVQESINDRNLRGMSAP